VNILVSGCWADDYNDLEAIWKIGKIYKKSQRFTSVSGGQPPFFWGHFRCWETQFV